MKRIVIDDRSGLLRIIGVAEDHMVPDSLNDGFGSIYTPIVWKSRYVVFAPPLSPSGYLGETFHPEQK
jgi:hypothetical protein